MKKFLLFTLIITLTMTAISVFAQSSVTVELDGNPIDCKDVNGNDVPPLLIDGTTYLPVRAVASALNLDIEWNDESKSVFINGAPEKAEKGENVNIYLNGVKFTAKDVNGTVVNPILQDGTTYLPIRAIGEAFDKKVSWDDKTKTAILTTPDFKTDFDENKVYAIVNKASGKAISVTDSGLVMENFNSYNYQGFKFIPSDIDGYYYIQSVTNSKNFDVNANSKTAGASIITYNPGTADNQKFAAEEADNGYVIYARSSKLPIEDSADKIKQNDKRDSIVQLWDIIEITPTEKSAETAYYMLSSSQSGELYDSSEGIFFGVVLDADPDSVLWALTPNEDGEYIITSKYTNKSLDVANNSKTSGDPIITYNTSGDANQRWVFEKQSDDTYLIKSVHSGLYLSIASDGSVVHSELNTALKQNWTVSVY